MLRTALQTRMGLEASAETQIAVSPNVRDVMVPESAVTLMVMRAQLL